MKNSYLTSVLYRLEQVSRDAHDNFFNLTDEQILWQPDENSWSIGQCLLHLILTDTMYFSQVQSVLTHTYRRPLLSYVPFLPEFWGRVVVKSVQPTVGTPLVAPKIFVEGKPLNPSTIVREFETHVANLTQLIRDTDHFNHKKIYFRSPVFKTIIYPLSATLELMANHHERHLNQALRVYKHPKFPKIRLNEEE